MRERLACLRAAFRRLFLLDPSPEPDEDDVSPAAFRQWVAASKHPDACRVGCQCRPDRR
jgi:hypothetical protein